ncbi:antigen-presenting glycoprotein CD1d-like isoform X1 [Cricetulus griseus]|uniref:Antigen-presenting glycoprotein CD1d-like isoform X1 n=1 Tax=Cricetulus griseus TaxID=10029 RepID=A0A9J7F6X8_CRIGR|nr:antigen-presenting glycoprotein CD1d-like isoform X1 [Cricetulus griseus]XP_027248811.1 antigen-presenting glycoprotein CD1d-like isoform X1 [Cricetulus griseus]
MRYLTCLLLWVFPRVWGQWEDQLKNYPLRCLQISSFPNSSSFRTDGLAWLGDVQTHSWRNASTVSFLKPWSHGKLSDQQWQTLEHILQVYRTSFTRDIQELVKMLPIIHYPIEMQVSAGCEVHSGNTSENFFNVASQGQHILSFQGTSFQKAPDAPPWTELAIKVLNTDQGTRETIQQLLNDTCPQVLYGLLEAGKAELDKQEKPVAWLSSVLSPRHGHLQLVCHVSGFYPQPVWVMWTQGEQEQNSTQRGDILPNADGTWYLRATLDVEAGEEAGLACRVKHSSLGGQDIILYWADGRHSSYVVFIILAVLILVVGLGLGFVFISRNRCSYRSIR